MSPNCCPVTLSTMFPRKDTSVDVAEQVVDEAVFCVEFCCNNKASKVLLESSLLLTDVTLVSTLQLASSRIDR